MKGNFLVRSSHIRDCLLILPRWNGRETIVDSSFLSIPRLSYHLFYILPISASISSSPSRSILQPLLSRGLYLELNLELGVLIASVASLAYEAPNQILTSLFPLLTLIQLCSGMAGCGTEPPRSTAQQSETTSASNAASTPSIPRSTPRACMRASVFPRAVHAHAFPRIPSNFLDSTLK
jgi:hypothetical protein